MTTQRVRFSSLRSSAALLVALVTTVAPAAAQFGAVGLSAVRGQRFGNENLIFYTPAEADFYAFALATGDFDGDGAGDLAVGVPLHDNLGGSTEDSGIVVVRYGVPGVGLSSDLADDVLSQVLPGSPDPAEVGDGFGRKLAACDLNGDGFDDLVVGIPHERHLGESFTGAVQIHFGFTPGLPLDGDTFITQSSPGIPGDVEAFHFFGDALACADFDGDGLDDLAVGVPGRDVGAQNAGSVVVIPGRPFPLDLAASYELSQEGPGMVDQGEFNDSYGSALAAGDFDGDGFADLAIGVPLETDGSDVRCGAVHLVMGSVSGLHGARDWLFTEANLLGTCVADDSLGRALASGDFDFDGFADLLIGVPGKDFGGGSVSGAGKVIAVYGDAAAFNLVLSQSWTEDAIFFPGASEAQDVFGSALASGDFDGDGFDDAAIGHPGESQLVQHDGAVTVLMGSAAGLTAARRHGLASGYYGLPGTRDQAGRQYGLTLVSGDFDGDGFVDLVVGSPAEDEGGLDNVGALVALYGSLFSDGFDSQSAGFWSGTTP